MTIQCPWRLIEGSVVVCDWNAESGPGGEIAKALAWLVGGVVTDLRVEGPAWDLSIRFGDKKLLQVFSDGDPADAAWFVIGIDGGLVRARPSTPDGGGITLGALQQGGGGC